MADVTPDYKMSQQKLIKEIADLEARFEAHKLALFELVGRKQSILENWAAEIKAVEAKRSNLKDLEEAHGPILELDLEAALASIDALVKKD